MRRLECRASGLLVVMEGRGDDDGIIWSICLVEFGILSVGSGLVDLA